MNTGTLKFNAQGEREIAMTRVFDAPRALVYDAFCKPELFKRWLLGPPGWSLPVCEIDLRVGGAMRFVWRAPDGKEMGMRGVYREIVPQERVVYSEVFDDWPTTESLVTTSWAEHDGKTTLSITIGYPSREIRDAIAATGMEQAVAANYERLADLLASTPARAG